MDKDKSESKTKAEFEMTCAPMAAYAAYSNDMEKRLKSSSGGIFSVLAEYVLSINGVVYGVAMSENCRKAYFLRVSEAQELIRLQGSKYLQARMGNTYRKVKSDLESGRNVLFTGTGCQINGLKGFLEKDYQNLYCVDVLCHGIPSPALWDKYVSYIEAKYQSKLKNVSFRFKDKKWMNCGTKVVDESNKRVYLSKDVDPYMQMFLRDYCLRPSCYECVAKKTKRSDVTIADFWGIDNVVPEINDGQGVSLVLLRTNQGMKIFEKIAGQIHGRRVSYEEGIRYNPVEYKSANRPLERAYFFDDMNTLSFTDLKAKYADSVSLSMKRRIKCGIKKMLKFIGGEAITGRINTYGLLYELEMNQEENKD